MISSLPFHFHGSTILSFVLKLGSKAHATVTCHPLARTWKKVGAEPISRARRYVRVGFMIDAIPYMAALAPYLILFLVSRGQGLREEAVQRQDPQLGLEFREGWNGALWRATGSVNFDAGGTRLGFLRISGG